MKFIQARGAVASGQAIDIGEIKTELPFAVATDDPDATGSEPYELTARVLAHIGHRIPGVRKVEKRLEGKNLSSGLLSDVLALGAQLASRNRPALESLAANLAARAQAQAQAKRAEANGTGQPDRVPEPEVTRP